MILKKLLNKINCEIIIINILLKYANIYTAYSSVFFNGIYILLNNVLYMMVPFRLVVPLCVERSYRKMNENCSIIRNWGNALNGMKSELYVL